MEIFNILFGIGVFTLYALDLSHVETNHFLWIFILTWLLGGIALIKLFKVKRGKIIFMIFFFFINFINIGFYAKIAKKTAFHLEKNSYQDNLILTAFEEKYPDDDFYFIDRMRQEKYSNEYLGKLYSKKLEKIKHTATIYARTYGNYIDKWSFGHYEGFLQGYELNKFLEKETKKIFGNKIRFDLGISCDIPLEEQLKIMSTKNSKEKLTAWGFDVIVFLDKGQSEEDYKGNEKIKKMADYLYNEVNIEVDKPPHIIYVNDDFFKNYETVKEKIFPPFRDDEEIIKILDKIKNQEEITEEEKMKIIEVYHCF